MISSEDALRTLLGWKEKKSPLYSQRMSPEGEGIPLGMVVVTDVNSEQLTLQAPGKRFTFVLSGATYSDGTGENDPQVNKTFSTTLLDIFLGDGGRLTLMEFPE